MATKVISPAEQKLNDYIERGKTQAAQVTQRLLDEVNSRIDFIVPKDKLEFRVASDGMSLALATPTTPVPFKVLPWAEDQALGDLFGGLGANTRFIRKLAQSNDGAKAATDIVNRLRFRIASKRLVRVVDTRREKGSIIAGNVKGFLSEDYKAINESEIVEEWIAATKAAKAVVVGGQITDRRFTLESVFPQIYQPWKNEFIVLKCNISSSDYGWGAAQVAFAWVRLLCINGTIGDVLFRKVHIGGRGNWNIEPDGFQASPKTERLFKQAEIAALGDAVKFAFSGRTRDRLLAAYISAADEKYDVIGGVQRLRASGVLGEADAEQIVNLVFQNEQIEILPQTGLRESRLRLQQAIAWLANQKQGEQRLSLQEEAGKLLSVPIKEN